MPYYKPFCREYMHHFICNIFLVGLVHTKYLNNKKGERYQTHLFCQLKKIFRLNFLIILYLDERSRILFRNYCFEQFVRYEIEILFDYDMSRKLTNNAFTSALSTPTIAIDSVKKYLFSPSYFSLLLNFNYFSRLSWYLISKIPMINLRIII